MNCPFFGESPLYRGVKQGDLLSPNLFNAVLEQIFRKLEWAKKEINIDGKHLNHLRYADYIVLISGDRGEVQGMLDELIAESEKTGLRVNVSKTKVMSRARIPWHLPDEFAEAPVNRNEIDIRFRVVGTQEINFILPKNAEMGINAENVNSESMGKS